MPFNLWEEVNTGAQEIFHPPDTNPAETVLGEATQVVNTMADAFRGVIGKAFDELHIDRAELEGLPEEQLSALRDFLNAVSSLKEKSDAMKELHEQVKRDIIGQPFQVAAKSENMQLAVNLYLAALRADAALKSAFAALNTLLTQFPELRANLESIDPKFATWLSPT